MTKARPVPTCVPARCLGTQLLSPEMSRSDFLVVLIPGDGLIDPRDSLTSLADRGTTEGPEHSHGGQSCPWKQSSWFLETMGVAAPLEVLVGSSPKESAARLIITIRFAYSLSLRYPEVALGLEKKIRLSFLTSSFP